MPHAPVREHCNCDWNRTVDAERDDHVRPCHGIFVEDDEDRLHGEIESGGECYCPECGSRAGFADPRGAGEECGAEVCRKCGGLA